MNIALVTAIYGDYDRPKPLRDDHGFDEVFLYTDDYDLGLEADKLGWTAVLHELDDIPTPMLRAKFWKTHPLEGPSRKFDVSVWLDGSIQITAPNFAQLCIDALGGDDVSMTPHPERRCIHPEAELTKKLARYADCDPIAQVEFYRNVIGHPDNWGLMASGASTRRHNDTVRCWGSYWWDDCVNWTYQDQLSLPVITRMMEQKGLKWNVNMPWHSWWSLLPHGF